MAGKLTIAIVVVAILVAFYALSDDFDEKAIRGKRVLVTGASSGIGARVAYKYAQLGAKLVITARRNDLLQKVAEKCKQEGAEEVYTVAADMGNAADRAKVVEVVEKQLRGLDYLILNHAYIFMDFVKHSMEDVTSMKKVMEINVFSFVELTSQLMKYLKLSRGRIGVVSSDSGKFGTAGLAHYCASKHALQGYFSSLRQELRYDNSGVSVTLIVYGPVASEFGLELFEKTAPSMVWMAGSCEDAADALARGVYSRRYEVLFPLAAHVTTIAYRITPYIFEDLFTWYFS